MRVAVAGAWHVHAKDYVKAAKRLGEVVGIFDEDAGRAAEFAKAQEVPLFATLDELLDSDAEGVIVCSATSAHTDTMVRIARRGKHIFTEKVLALTEADCQRVRQAVETAGVRFVISMPQKCAAGPRTVKALADAGRLGKINYLRVRNCHGGSLLHWLPAHFYNKNETGGGAMIDLGAHGMYLTDWFLGEPLAYRSVFTHVCRDEKDRLFNPDALEDNAVTVMSYRDGAIAVNETGFVSQGCPMTLEVGGSLGYAVFSAGKVLLNAQDTDKKTVEIPLLPAEKLPIEAFLQGEEPAGCGMREALTLTRMMQGAYAAAQ